MKDLRTSYDKLSDELDKEIEALGISKLSKTEQAALHYQWRVKGDQQAYHKLFLYSMRMVYKIVNKLDKLNMLGSDIEDAVSNGIMGITDSLEKWESNRSALNTYVWVCVRRHILNGNTSDWQRGLQGDMRWSGGAPTHHEETVESAMDWDMFLDEDPTLKAAIQMELEGLVRSCLSDMQRKVLYLRYTKEMDYRAIGNVLGYTHVRAYQIEREALEVLRGLYL